MGGVLTATAITRRNLLSAILRDDGAARVRKTTSPVAAVADSAA
jgi:hypothetical protein